MINKQNALNDNNRRPDLYGQKILEAVQGIRYGSVEIVIHDGRIVQIERKEKLRLEGDGAMGSR